MSGEIISQASDLTKFYGEILAVDHINFDIKRGEIFGFLGLEWGREDHNYKDTYRALQTNIGKRI